MPTPTQVQRPWRATVRTVFAAVVAFAAMWGLIVEAIGLNPEWQWVSVSLLVTGAITRVLALPQVEDFLARFFPWLAADPTTTGRHTSEAGRTDARLALTLTTIAAGGILAAWFVLETLLLLLRT